MAKPNPPRQTEDAMLAELYSRPGFMLRRAHQIAIDLFIQACMPVNVTPSQYGVLYIINTVGSISQIGISRLIGLDRSTTALVVKLLTERGLLTRKPSTKDARKIEIELTKEGRKIFHQAEKFAHSEMQMLLEPFTDQESEQFLNLLGKFVNHHNDKTRVSVTGSAALEN